MSHEEFYFILTAIEFIAMYGHRFLYCYHFNWTTGAWNFKKKSLKGSSLASMINELNSQETRVAETKESVFANYLETANLIASLLPEIPPHRNIPKDIDIGLVPFKV